MESTPTIETSSGLDFLSYGSGVWWYFENFSVQVDLLLDVFDVRYPNMQLLLEVDHSSGHTKQQKDGLNVDEMNLKHGGKQGKLRSSVMTETTVNSQAPPEELVILIPFSNWTSTSSKTLVANNHRV